MATQLRREPGSSLHHQISAVIRSNILAGRYGENEYLPGESAMMEMFGVSRATVRRALLTLEGEQLIDRRQGKGTRVVYQRHTAGKSLLEQHLQKIEQSARLTTVRLLEFDWTGMPLHVQALLGIEDQARALKIVRLRLGDAQPLRYLVNYLPPAVGAKVARDQFQGATLISVLNAVGHPVQRFEDELGAVLADATTARALEVPIGAPLVELTRVMFDRDDQPLAFQWTVIPPDRCKLRTSVDASEG